LQKLGGPGLARNVTRRAPADLLIRPAQVGPTGNSGPGSIRRTPGGPSRSFVPGGRLGSSIGPGETVLTADALRGQGMPQPGRVFKDGCLERRVRVRGPSAARCSNAEVVPSTTTAGRVGPLEVGDGCFDKPGTKTASRFRLEAGLPLGPGPSGPPSRDVGRRRCLSPDSSLGRGPRRKPGDPPSSSSDTSKPPWV